jgi:RHS repeat-associated protein
LALGYTVTDYLNQKFTSKERDAETGLDFFDARYFSGAQGRFASPDPLMASANAKDPQTWNRYALTLNNPLRYVDPDGMEVPASCADNSKCTIEVKVNVIYDTTANNGQGLTADQKKQFEQGQLAQALKDYGTSNIKLDFTYTAGTYTVDPSTGKSYVTGLQADALNIMASTGTPTGAAGDSSASRSTGTALTFINVNDAIDTNKLYPLATNTTEHELGHQFLGHPFLPDPNSLQYLGREAEVDARVKGQANGISQTGFREGLEPRRYAVPANPEANKPRQ